MEKSGYESVTFRMKRGYTQKDLTKAIGMLRRAFEMSHPEIGTIDYIHRSEYSSEVRDFTIYFKNGRKL